MDAQDIGTLWSILGIGGLAMVAAIWLDRARAGRRQELEEHELAQAVIVRHYPSAAEYEAHARELFAHGFAVASVAPQRAWNLGLLGLATLFALLLLILFWPLAILVMLVALFTARRSYLTVTYTRSGPPSRR